MFSIGEFSRITGLPIKTLRFYHEQNILVPTHVDEQNGYRYYGEAKVETARMISELRKLDFSLEQIGQILQGYNDEGEILEFLESQREHIQKQLDSYREIGRSLDQIIKREKEAQETIRRADFEIQEQAVDTMLIAAVRMQAKYSDCGQAFAQIGRRFGKQICGKPFLLIHDCDYKETADFEACMPIRRGNDKESVAVRELPSRTYFTLLHQGPYTHLGRSYAKLMSHLRSNGVTFEVPIREVYLKGPGMIFQGNPKKYLTEIQMAAKA